MISAALALLQIASAADMARDIERGKACLTDKCVCELTPWRQQCPIEDLPAVPQDVVQCARQPGLPWCQAACASGNWEWCEGLPLDVALGIEAYVRERFTFKEERADDWDSQAEEILSDKPAIGDCDTYASTVLQLLAMAGSPPDRLGRALVRDQATRGADHQIGLGLFAGEWWIIADSLDKPRRLAGSGVKIVWSQKVSDGMHFAKGANAFTLETLK